MDVNSNVFQGREEAHPTINIFIVLSIKDTHRNGLLAGADGHRGIQPLPAIQKVLDVSPSAIDDTETSYVDCAVLHYFSFPAIIHHLRKKAHVSFLFVNSVSIYTRHFSFYNFSRLRPSAEPIASVNSLNRTNF